MAEKRKALREEAAKIEYLRETTPEKEPRRRAKREDVTLAKKTLRAQTVKRAAQRSESAVRVEESSWQKEERREQ